MRWVGRLFALIGFLLFVAAGALGLGGHLAASGHDLRLLKRIATNVADRLAGQRIERLSLDVTLDPDEGTLHGRARLAMRATVEGRRRFYFLLGDSLRLKRFAAVGFPQARAYKLWLIAMVDLGATASPEQPVDIGLEYEGSPESGLFGLGTARLSPREVQLSVDSFWFPNDLQGQFEADVAVSLPAYMTLVHAGEETERSTRGRLQRVRWHYARPVPSLSLVAGPYRTTDLQTEAGSYRLYLADDIELDAERVLRDAAGADAFLTERFGPSGFKRLSFFVSRKMRRAYNDGAGVMGLSIRHFRRGDYGFVTVAHEIAHNWFGATVMEEWLRPGTGGEWLVEGFAEYSSVLAAEARFGREARVRRLAALFFDPRRNRAVGEMSVLDNAVGDDAARDIIYAKGGYVVSMLHQQLGDAAFFGGLRAFLDRYRYRGATDRDLEEVLADGGRGPATGGQQDLTAFFAEWVRSDHALDLALDSDESGKLILRNVGNNPVVGQISVADSSPAPSPQPPAPDPVAVGDTVPVPGKSGEAIDADPTLVWADMSRDNNLFPRRRFPLAVAPQASGWAEIESEVYPWSAATLRSRAGDGSERASWELPATVVSWPEWLDAQRLVLNTTDAASPEPKVEIFDLTAGKSEALGRGAGAAVVGGVVYAARRDRLVRWQPPGWREEVLARHPRHVVGAVTPSPDGRQVAYAVGRDNDMSIEIFDLGSRRGRSLLRWDRDLRDLAWSSDGTRLFAAIGGDWDWQVWEIAVDGGPVRVLASEAAAIGNLAVAPDGDRIAFAAAPAVDYPFNRKEVVLLDVSNRSVKRLPVAGDARQVAWLDGHTLLAVVAPNAELRLPEERRVEKIAVD